MVGTSNLGSWNGHWLEVLPIVKCSKLFFHFQSPKARDVLSLRHQVCFWVHFPSGLHVRRHVSEHGLHRCHGSEGCCLQILSGRVATLPVETPTNEPVHFPGRCSPFGRNSSRSSTAAIEHVPSGNLTSLWKITMFNATINGKFQ